MFIKQIMFRNWLKISNDKSLEVYMCASIFGPIHYFFIYVISHLPLGSSPFLLKFKLHDLEKVE